MAMWLRGGCFGTTAWEDAIDRALDMDRLGGACAWDMPQTPVPKGISAPEAGEIGDARIKAKASKGDAVTGGDSDVAPEMEDAKSASVDKGAWDSSSKEGNEIAEIPLSKNLQRAMAMKEKGSELFRAGRFEEAVLQYLSAKSLADEEPVVAGKHLAMACSLNLASCCIEMGDHTNSVRFASTYT